MGGDDKSGIAAGRHRDRLLRADLHPVTAIGRVKSAEAAAGALEFHPQGSFDAHDLDESGGSEGTLKACVSGFYWRLLCAVQLASCGK